MRNRKLSTKFVVKVGILSTLGFLLMLIRFPLPFLPPFLTLDASDLAAVISGITMGPLAALLTQLVMNLVKFIVDSRTGGVGELANFLIGSSFVVPLSYIFRKKQDKIGFIFGSIVGIVSMVVFASVLNYFFLVPFYAALFGGMDLVIAASQAVNSNIDNIGSLILFGIVPFNIIKGIFASVLGYFVYVALEPALKRYFN